MNEAKLLEWFVKLAKTFLTKYAPERLATLVNDHARLKRLIGLPDCLTVALAPGVGTWRSSQRRSTTSWVGMGVARRRSRKHWC